MASKLLVDAWSSSASRCRCRIEQRSVVAPIEAQRLPAVAGLRAHGAEPIQLSVSHLPQKQMVDCFGPYAAKATMLVRPTPSPHSDERMPHWMFARGAGGGLLNMTKRCRFGAVQGRAQIDSNCVV